MIRTGVRAVASAVGLTVVLLVLPWGMATGFGWPLPHRWPSTGQLRLWLAQQPTLTTVAAAAVCVVWLLWAWILYAVVAAVLARIRRPTRSGRRRIRLAVPLHAVASSAVGSLVLTTAVTPAPASTVAPAGPGPIVPTSPSNTHVRGSATTEPTGPTPGLGADLLAADRANTAVGVTVRGGWLPPATAALVAAVGALVWLRRRAGYRPSLAGERIRGVDRDLTDLPATVTALRRATRTTVGGEPGPPVAVEAEAATAVGAAAVIGMDAEHPVTVTDLPPTGVGLVGPGAIPAARAILVTALAAGIGDPTGPVVHTTRDDAAILFGPDNLAAPRRLVVHPDLPTALTILEQLNPPDARQVPGRSASGHAVVLVAETPAGGAAHHLAAILTRTLSGVRVVLLGTWPVGHTWHIRANGEARTHTDLSSMRLGVLDVRAGTDILTTLAAAEPADLAAPPVHGSPHPADSDQPTPVGPRPAQPIGPSGGPALALRILGHPRLTHARSDPGGGGEVRVRRSAAWEILLFLAVHPDGANTDEVKEAVWPEVASSLAAGRFNTTMSELRQLLREAAGTPVIRQQPGPTAGRARHYLDPDQVSIDLWQFHDAVTAAGLAITPAERTAALRQAVAGYGGDLADGCGFEWIHPYRETARRRLLDAYLALADHEPDHTAAVTLLQEAIRRAPHTEALYQEAIRRHLAAGHRDAARHTLHTLTNQLRPLGLTPDPDTVRLATMPDPAVTVAPVP